MTDSELLREALGLKSLDRAGWVRVGVPHPESVAAHSFGVALIALVRCPAKLNREKVLAMALLHDLAEVRVGDITPHDRVPREEKKRREHEAISSMLAARPDLLALWNESEAGQSAEARFVKQCDLADLGLQTVRYAREGIDTSEFLADPRVPAAVAALD